MDLNLQKPEGVNLLRKYLHMCIISLFGICCALGGEYIMQTPMKEKISVVNLFCIKTVQYIAGVWVSSRPQGTCRGGVLSHWTNGTCSHVQAKFSVSVQKLIGLLPCSCCRRWCKAPLVVPQNTAREPLLIVERGCAFESENAEEIDPEQCEGIFCSQMWCLL